MKKYYFLLVLVFVLFFLISSRNILAGDTMFLYDQAREIVLVQQMLLTHKLSLIGTRSGIGGLFHGPLWLYTLIPFYLLGHGNPFYLTYAYESLMLVTILAGFIVGKKLYNAPIGLLIAFLLATNNFLWPNVVFMHGLYVLPLAYLGFFYFFIKFFRGNKRSFIAVCFFTGLTMQFETSSSLILLALLPVFLILVSWYREQYVRHEKFLTLVKRLPQIIRANITFLVSCFLAVLISLSTFIFFDLRHQFLTAKSLISFFTNHQKGTGYLEIFSRFLDHTNSFLGIYKFIPFQTDKLLALLVLAILISACWQILVQRAIKVEFKSEIVICFIFPIFMYLPFLFYAYPVYPEYISGLIIPITIAVALMIYNLWHTQWGKVILSTFFLITILSIVRILGMLYFQFYNYNASDGSLSNQEAIVSWIYQDASGKPFAYFVYTPNTFTYGMDYLFRWEGKKYHNQPSQVKLQSTYLIMFAPLTNDNNAHAFWKKNVIHTNALVVKRKIFTGNVLVEKLDIINQERPVDPNYFQNLIFR